MRAWACMGGAPAVAVLAALRLHADHETGECHPATQTVAELAGMSRRNAFRVVKRAEAAGLITRSRRRGAPNVFRLALPGGDRLSPPELDQVTTRHPHQGHAEHGGDDELSPKQTMNKPGEQGEASEATAAEDFEKLWTFWPVKMPAVELLATHRDMALEALEALEIFEEQRVAARMAITEAQDVLQVISAWRAHTPKGTPFYAEAGR